jgi:hypothetical protein
MLAKGAQMGRNVETLRPSLKALVSLTLTLKGAQCFKI